VRLAIGATDGERLGPVYCTFAEGEDHILWTDRQRPRGLDQQSLVILASDARGEGEGIALLGVPDGDQGRIYAFGRRRQWHHDQRKDRPTVDGLELVSPRGPGVGIVPEQAYGAIIFGWRQVVTALPRRCRHGED